MDNVRNIKFKEPQTAFAILEEALRNTQPGDEVIIIRKRERDIEFGYSRIESIAHFVGLIHYALFDMMSDTRT